LTGATGSLGVFILSKLSALPSEVVKKIVCLVRAENDDSAAQRVFDMAKQRGISVGAEKIEVYSADLAKDHLGLTEDIYEKLADQVDDVIHVSIPHSSSRSDLIKGGMARTFRQ
jgi:thioester reductase-like protein